MDVSDMANSTHHGEHAQIVYVVAIVKKTRRPRWVGRANWARNIDQGARRF